MTHQFDSSWHGTADFRAAAISSGIGGQLTFGGRDSEDRCDPERGASLHAPNVASIHALNAASSWPQSAAGPLLKRYQLLHVGSPLPQLLHQLGTAGSQLPINVCLKWVPISTRAVRDRDRDRDRDRRFPKSLPDANPVFSAKSATWRTWIRLSTTPRARPRRQLPALG